MIRTLTLLACAALGMSGCGNASPSAPLPRGATLEPSGFATIVDVPPAPFVTTDPRAPKPPTAAQLADQEQMRRATAFQGEVYDDVIALRDTLERREKGNFVDFYYENEGEPHVVYRFLRDPQATLAKYTSDPRYRAARAGYTEEELSATLDRMMAAFRDDRVIMGGGTGNKENRVVLDLLVPRAQFLALARRKGIEIPDSVLLRSNFENETAAKANRPLPAGIARLLRVFPRSDRPVGIVNSIASTATIVLKDGCLRSPDHGNAFVLLPMGASLFIDPEGYLAFGSSADPGYARIGETVTFGGSIYDVETPELVEPIHAACGPGRVININGLKSAAADRAQQSLGSNLDALRQFTEMYGLNDVQAAQALDACKTRSGGRVCLLSPPPPAARNEGCPSGTSRSHGLCRTGDGFVRPLPDWLRPFAGVDG